MSISLNLQYSLTAVRLTIGSHGLYAQRLKTRSRRSPKSQASRRYFTTFQRRSDSENHSDHPGAQDEQRTLSGNFWAAARYPPKVKEHNEAHTYPSKPGVGLGWPSIYQRIDRFEISRKRRPFKLGFPVFDDGNLIPTNERHPSSECASHETLWHTINRNIDGQDPYRLLFSMLDAASEPGVLPDMAPTKFRAIFRRLSPKHFIEPYQQLVLPKAQGDLDERSTPKVISMFHNYVDALLTLVGRRHASGCKVSLEEYRLLLGAAAAARSQPIASHIWIAMLEDKVEPDLASYNLLFEALCYASTHAHGERVRLRLIKTNSVRYRRPSSSDSSYKFGIGGVHETVIYWYNHMCNRGLSPDADTYGFVMVALGRVRFVKDIKRLVRGTWDIDLDNIPRTKVQSPKGFQISIDPSCTPKPSTLRHLMHVMCINNQLTEAMRAIEYMAELYSIRIPAEALEELVLWTGALSAHRTNRQMSDWKGYGVGQVKKSTMREVWKTIHEEPYNVKPTMRVLDALCSNASRRMALTELLKYVRDGVRIYRHQLREYLEALHRQAEGILLIAAQGEPSHRPSEIPSRYQLHHEVQVARAKECVSFGMIRRWFRLLLRGERFMGHMTADRIVDWDRQVIPDLVQELWHFRSAGVHYSPQQFYSPGEAHGRGEIQFKEGVSDLAEWGQLQHGLDLLPLVINAQLPSVSEMERHLDACKRRGIDTFITEILGAEEARRVPFHANTAAQHLPNSAPLTTSSMLHSFRMMYPLG